MRSLPLTVALMLLAGLACKEPARQGDDPIAVHFDGGYGQIEVGSPFMGFEFHDSRPLPSRDRKAGRAR